MISNILQKGLEKNPQKVAIYYYEKEFTYQELHRLVNQLAAGFQQKMKLNPGDVVAIQSTNTIEMVLTLLACWRIGVTVTPMNPALKSNEIAYQLNHSNAKCYIYQGNCSEKAQEAVEELGNSIHRIVIDGDAGEREAPFQSLLSDEYLVKDNITEDTLAVIIYTSGTTGKPKGVMLTHQNVTVMCNMLSEHLDLYEDDRSYMILPLFHVNSIHFTLSVPLLLGGSVVLRHRFNADDFLESIHQYRPTYLVAVPTVYNLLANLPEESISFYDLGSIKFASCGGAPLSLSEISKFESKYPIQIVEAWGLSEGASVSTSNPLYGKKKVGSIGIPLPGQEVKVVNEQENEVLPFERGELIVKGANITPGYLNNLDETNKTIKNGWLYTGDIGYQDDEGYYYIVDRKKEVIIRGGLNIYPKEIEEVIYQIPDVMEAAVLGMHDDKYGEEVLAYISLQKSSNIQEKDIIIYCQEKLANYKCPKKIVLLDSLPKNAVGKISKVMLKDFIKNTVDILISGKELTKYKKITTVNPL